MFANCTRDWKLSQHNPLWYIIDTYWTVRWYNASNFYIIEGQSGGCFQWANERDFGVFCIGHRILLHHVLPIPTQPWSQESSSLQPSSLSTTPFTPLEIYSLPSTLLLLSNIDTTGSLSVFVRLSNPILSRRHLWRACLASVDVSDLTFNADAPFNPYVYYLYCRGNTISPIRSALADISSFFKETGHTKRGADLVSEISGAMIISRLNLSQFDGCDCGHKIVTKKIPYRHTACKWTIPRKKRLNQ